MHQPFLAGLLTDERADRYALPSGDRMRDPSWDGAYRRLAILREHLAPGSITAFAIQFALAHPIVASLIVGLNTVAQVDQVIDAAAEPAPLSHVRAGTGDLRGARAHRNRVAAVSGDAVRYPRSRQGS